MKRRIYNAVILAFFLGAYMMMLIWGSVTGSKTVILSGLLMALFAGVLTFEFTKLLAQATECDPLEEKEEGP